LSGSVDSSWNPNVNNNIQQINLINDDVYITGLFTKIGDYDNNYFGIINKIDGSLIKKTNLKNYINPNNTINYITADNNYIYVAGSFTSFGNQNLNRIARFNKQTQKIDPSWNPNSNGSVSAIYIDSSFVYLGGSFTTLNGSITRNRIARIPVSDQNGNIDSLWDPSVNSSVSNIIADSSYIYLCGFFTSINNSTTRNRIARIAKSNTLGIVDSSWNPDVNGTVNNMVLDNTYIYLGGQFTTINSSITRNNIARIPLSNLTGSVDATWDPNANTTVNTLFFDSSYVYVGGQFTSINGLSRNRAVRIQVNNSIGTIDLSWNPNVNSTLSTIYIDSSYIYLGGSFSTINGSITRNRIARILKTDISGNVDLSWNPDGATSSASSDIGSIYTENTDIYIGGSHRALVNYKSLYFTPTNILNIPNKLLLNSINYLNNNGFSTTNIINKIIYQGDSVNDNFINFTGISGESNKTLARHSLLNILQEQNPSINYFKMPKTDLGLTAGSSTCDVFIPNIQLNLNDISNSAYINLDTVNDYANLFYNDNTLNVIKNGDNSYLINDISYNDGQTIDVLSDYKIKLGGLHIYQNIVLNSSSIVHPTTVGGNDGSITLVFSGGSPPYTYYWYASNGFTSTSEDISGLSVGQYSLDISDNDGSSKNYTFNLYNPIFINNSTILQPSITDACGSIFIDVSGGNSDYTFNWYKNDVSGYASTQDISAAIGSYKVIISDSSNISFIEINNIFEIFNPINIISDSISNTSDLGNSDGSIIIDISGGNGNYTFNWYKNNISGYANTKDISGGVGTYFVDISDNSGNTFTSSSFIIRDPIKVISGTTFNTSDLGNSDGSIFIDVSGGNSDYTFNWYKNDISGYASTKDISGSAGEYKIIISDSSSTSFIEQDNIFYIYDPVTITLNTQVNVSVFGGNDGSITVDVSGGNFDYTYLWYKNSVSTGVTTKDISNIDIGDYYLVATDTSSNVGTSSTFTITQPFPPINITSFSLINPITSVDESGSIFIDVSGGNSNYTFNWYKNNISGYANTKDISGGVGTYFVDISDTSGNTFTSNTFYLWNPIEVLSGTTFNTSDLGNSDGSIFIDVSGGNSDYTFNWYKNNISGYASTKDISGGAGEYKIIISDSSSTSFIEQDNIFYIYDPVTITLNTQVNVSVFGGNDGSITVDVSGGNFDYTYLWYKNSVSTGITTKDISNIDIGDYYLVATDTSSNVGTSSTFTITQPFPPINITSFSLINPVTSVDESGSIFIDVSGGNSNYTFNWYKNNISGYANTKDISGGVGTYFVDISDTSGNTLTSNTFYLWNPIQITDLSFSLISVYDGSNGSITIDVSGGNSDYTFSWTKNGVSYASTQNITDLSWGSYEITISDSSGTNFITANNSVHLANPPEIPPGASFGNPIIPSGTIITFPAGVSEELVFTEPSGAALTTIINNIVSDPSADPVLVSKLNSSSNVIIVTLEPSGTQFSEYIAIPLTITSTSNLFVFYKTGTSSELVPLTTPNYTDGPYYTIVSSSEINAYVKHFSDLGFGNEGGGIIGDPFIKPLFGESYYLPNDESTYLLLDNNENLKIYTKTWMPIDVKNGTMSYMRYLIIDFNLERICLDLDTMNWVSLIENNFYNHKLKKTNNPSIENFNFDRNKFSNYMDDYYGNNFKLSSHNKQMTINLNLDNNKQVVIKIITDLKYIDIRNNVNIKLINIPINEIKNYKGAYINKEKCKIIKTNNFLKKTLQLF
jgi:hypothetical protein